MLDRIKQSLRISNCSLDDEILANVEACKADLQMGGAAFSNEAPLCIQAVSLYCRWAFNYNNQGDKYLQAYKALKIALALTSEADKNE